MGRPRSGIEPRIVHAARARFLAEGVDGASLRTIAADARTSIGMVSYYFPSKDDLFLAVVEEVYAKLLHDLERLFAEPRPLRERMTRVATRVGAMSDHELSVVRLVVREALSSSTRFQRLLSRFQSGHIPVVLDALAKGVGQGEITGDLPLPMLFVATLAMLGVPQLVRRVAGAAMPFALLPDAASTAALAADALFLGIGSRDGRRAPAPAKARARRRRR
jgi:AcrR family transcriptional regulator